VVIVIDNDTFLAKYSTMKSIPLPITLKFLYTTICLMSFILSNAQTSLELDRKNGFLDFKFGTPPSAYAGKIKKLNLESVVNGSIRYEVTDPAYKRVLGYDVSKIDLTFSDNKLWAITIDFIHEDVDKAYSFLDYKLKNLFGQPIGTIRPTDGECCYYPTGHRWKGEKTTLDLVKTQMKQTEKYYACIYYINNELEKRAINKEF